MRLNLPRKKKRRIAWFPLIVLHTIFLVVITLFGEEGLLHALTMRIYKEQAEEIARAQIMENERLTYLIQNMHDNPMKLKTVLAEEKQMTEKSAVIYQFKTIDDLPSVEMLSEVEGLSWLQRTKLRWTLTLKNFFE